MYCPDFDAVKSPLWLLFVSGPSYLKLYLEDFPVSSRTNLSNYYFYSIPSLSMLTLNRLRFIFLHREVSLLLSFMEIREAEKIDDCFWWEKDGEGVDKGKKTFWMFTQRSFFSTQFVNYCSGSAFSFIINIERSQQPLSLIKPDF